MNEVFEFKSDEILKEKAKFAWIANKVMNGIMVAVAMIILRVFLIWMFSFGEAGSFKELFAKRYYYGGEGWSIGMNITAVIARAGMLMGEKITSILPQNFIVSLITIIAMLPIGIVSAIILIPTIFLWPIMLINYRIMCVIDSIVPQNMNILLGWFIVCAVMGAIVSVLIGSIEPITPLIVILIVLIPVCYLGKNVEMINNHSNINISLGIEPVEIENPIFKIEDYRVHK